MLTFILWCLLFLLCWPLALLAPLLYVFVWLAILPFRVLGIAAEGILSLARAVLMLPGRLIGGQSRG